MPGTTYWKSWRSAIRFSANVCLAFLFASCFLPSNASAQMWASGSNGLTLQINAGFHTRYRNDNWIPVQVLARNMSSDFTGTLSIGVSNLQPAALLYQEPITLPHGAQKEVAFSLPLYLEASGTQSLLVKLLDNSGNVVLSQVSALNAVGSQDVFVGILSDQPSGFEMLRAISVPGQGGSLITERLDASTFPSTGAVLRNFNLIVLDDFTTSSLSRSQLLALESWVNQGGALIEVGGPEWQRTLSVLPADLLPVHIDGMSVLPPKTSLVPIDGPGTQPAGTAQGQMPGMKVPQTFRPQGIAPTVIISTATVVNGGAQGIAPPFPFSQTETILAAGDIPLLVQTHRGQGIVCYLAFDPTLEPLASWAGTSMLWKALLIRGLGDQLFTASADARFGTSGSGMMGMLQALLPNALVSSWVLALLLLAYLLLLGPGRSYIMRRYGGKDARRRMDWSWRIVLISIVVFSLLTYGLALNQKGRAIVSSSISVIQLNEGSASAHVTTYLSIFVPNQGDFSVHLPGNTVAQPLPSDLLQGDMTFSGQTTVTSDSEGTDIRLRGVDIWTLRTILAEQDRQIHGGIISHLILQDGKLTGTLTNTLGYDLNDVYILFPGGFVRIAHVSAGQTQHLSLLLNTPKTDPDMTLADQIAASYKLPTPYTISPDVAQPQNETQRHIAILNALSSEGYCSGSGKCQPLPSPALSLKTSSLLIPGPNAYRVHSIDPLLLPGQAATLLGWEDIQGQQVDAMDGMTVNGITPGGTHETLIQAPLNVTFHETQQPLTPATFIPGQVVDVQADKVDLQASGIYALSNGSMTFEFAVPSSTNIQALSSMTLIESLARRQGFIAEQVTEQFGAYLYNWRTGEWDAIPLSIFTYTTPDTEDYIGPGGRVLLQCVNQDPSQGPLLFNRPSLSLTNSQGT